jgi:protein-tyrosine phosphatase
LFVCTANICRSPIAAELARRKIQAAARPDTTLVVVGSAGTHGLDGAAMDPRAVAALRSLSRHPADFSSRLLTSDLMATSDLVLTAQRRHRAAAIALHPRSHPKVFTIREFARLVQHVDPDRLPRDSAVPRAQALIRAAARLRGVVPPSSTNEDITDPYGRPAEDYLACAEAIDAALDLPLRLIFA